MLPSTRIKVSASAMHRFRSLILTAHLLAVYASLPPVARRKARLATGLPASALARLDFHQLDSFERFHPLIWSSPFPSFAWRDIPSIRHNFLSSSESCPNYLSNIRNCVFPRLSARVGKGITSSKR